MFRPVVGLVALSIASTLTFASPKQSAEEQNATASNPCSLIKSGDLAQWGYGTKPATESSSRIMKKEAMGSPADFQSSECDYRAAKSPGRAFVVVETFADDVAKEVISDWLKAMDAKAKSKPDPTEKSEEVTLGDTVCESGEYLVVLKMGEPQVLMHYVACDKLSNRSHVSVNFEWPGDDPKLPTSAEAKGLLDQAVALLP